MDLEAWAIGGGLEIEQAPAPAAFLKPQTRKIRDSFYTAPGYREIGMFYSCVPDPAHPWDPKIMKKILEFAPDATPLWVHWVFKSPQDTGEPETVIFGRHGLGRHIRGARVELIPLHVTMPSLPCGGVHFEKPNAIWFIHQGPMGQHPKYKDLPGDYLPFDHSILTKALEASTGFQMTEDEYKKALWDQMVVDPVKREIARLMHQRSERQYALKDVKEYADRQYDKVSESEAIAHYLSRGYLPREIKPTVVLGSTPKE